MAFRMVAIAQDKPRAAQGIGPATALVVPMAKAMLMQETTDAEGAPLLTLYHRGKEVSWDDPRHFNFARELAKRPHFHAGEAARRGDLGWDEAQPMLASLIDEGILALGDGHAEAERHDHLPMSSPLPPALLAEPRSWMDPASLMEELTGTALDIAWLEAVVPVFRTGHLFIDRDGRQVGEANAFPAAARIDAPTDWRGCPYAGNRYQAEKPMNATALKAMRKHWRAMMALLLRVREGYLSRFSEARQAWTVGHVERLAVSVLALPSVVMLDAARPTGNGDLHPVLSNLFRVTDGLRMVVHQMLFLPLYEPMKRPEAPVDAAAILDYADRNFAFHSDHGVCAGPRFMIEDFLGVILDGRVPQGGIDDHLDAELEAAAARVDQAIDYAMLGLETYATTFALWPAMAQTYVDLNEVLAVWAKGAAAQAMAERFAGHFDALSHRSFLASAEWRAHRLDVYDDMFAAARLATTGSKTSAALSAILSSPIRVADDAQQPLTTLASAAAAHFGTESAELASEFAIIAMRFLQRGQATVALVEAIQARTAALLGRVGPQHRLTLANLNLHNVLMGEDQRSVPFLPDEIARLLGVEIHVDAETIEIGLRHAAAAPSHSPAPLAGEYPVPQAPLSSKKES